MTECLNGREGERKEEEREREDEEKEREGGERDEAISMMYAFLEKKAEGG